jgi:hypothetical protein
VLEVQIQKIDLDVPYSCNNFGPGRGFLPNDFPYARMKIIPLDRERMVGQFGPGISPSAVSLYSTLPLSDSMSTCFRGGAKALRNCAGNRTIGRPLSMDCC